MKKTKILPYKMYSAGARELSKALAVKRIKKVNSRYRGRVDKKVINWGSGVIPPHIPPSQIINLHARNAHNKLRAFRLMSEGVSIPPFTESREEASKWLLEGKAVVCRTILNGHSGNGITIADTPEQLVDAPLYVQYIPKKDEYRVHVVKGEVIHVQRKARNRDVENPDWRIRNHHNGFIFSIGDCDPDPSVLRNAQLAVEHLNLDFGAVDVIWNDKKKKAYVLEVNTSPGLVGATLQKYKEAFEKL